MICFKQLVGYSVILLNDDKGNFTNVSGNAFPLGDVYEVLLSAESTEYDSAICTVDHDDGNQVCHETYPGLHDVSAPLTLI